MQTPRKLSCKSDQSNLRVRSYFRKHLKTFPKIQNVEIIIDLDLSDNDLLDFTGMINMPALESINISYNSVCSFNGAVEQKNLKQILAKKTPLANYKYANIMCLIVFGPQLQIFNQSRITNAELKQSIKYRDILLPYLSKGWILSSLSKEIIIYNPETQKRKKLFLKAVETPIKLTAQSSNKVKCHTPLTCSRLYTPHKLADFCSDSIANTVSKDQINGKENQSFIDNQEKPEKKIIEKCKEEPHTIKNIIKKQQVDETKEVKKLISSTRKKSLIPRPKVSTELNSSNHKKVVTKSDKEQIKKESDIPEKSISSKNSNKEQCKQYECIHQIMKKEENIPQKECKKSQENLQNSRAKPKKAISSVFSTPRGFTTPRREFISSPPEKENRIICKSHSKSIIPKSKKESGIPIKRTKKEVEKSTPKQKKSNSIKLEISPIVTYNNNNRPLKKPQPVKFDENSDINIDILPNPVQINAAPVSSLHYVPSSPLLECFSSDCSYSSLQSPEKFEESIKTTFKWPERKNAELKHVVLKFDDKSDGSFDIDDIGLPEFTFE